MVLISNQSAVHSRQSAKNNLQSAVTRQAVSNRQAGTDGSRQS